MSWLSDITPGYIFGLFVVFSWVALLLFFIFNIAYAFSGGEGSGARWKRALRKMSIWLWSIFIVCASWNYYQDASVRAKVTKFHRELSDDEANKGEYMAEYAYLPLDRILLRVYRTSDMELLAERTYLYLDAARLTWTKNSLIYDTSIDNGGEINLPPTLYDRLMAKLP
jgi:hypothetical protein